MLNEASGSAQHVDAAESSTGPVTPSESNDDRNEADRRPASMVARGDVGNGNGKRKGKGKARDTDPCHPAFSFSSGRNGAHFSEDDDEHLNPNSSSDITKDSDAETMNTNRTDGEADAEQDDQPWCLICHTTPIQDPTVLPKCLHSQFCFVCIVRWMSIKRSCPLCLAEVGEYVIHAVREDDDFVRWYLPPPPLASSTCTPTTPGGGSSNSSVSQRRDMVRQVQRARMQRSTAQHDEASARTLAFRAHIYRHLLYAHHVGSNPHTGYTSCPTPLQIRQSLPHANGADIVRRITTFLRRELTLFPHVDVEWVTRYIVSLCQVWRVGDDEMVRCVGEFVGGEARARHLLHELECWLRSARRELRFWDASPLLQYGEGVGAGRRRMGRRDELGQGGDARVDGQHEDRRERNPDRSRSRTGGTEKRTDGINQAGKRQRPTAEQPGQTDVADNGQQDRDEAKMAHNLRSDVAVRRTKLLDRLERERSLLKSSKRTP